MFHVKLFQHKPLIPNNLPVTQPTPTLAPSPPQPRSCNGKNRRVLIRNSQKIAKIQGKPITFHESISTQDRISPNSRPSDRRGPNQKQTTRPLAYPGFKARRQPRSAEIAAQCAPSPRERGEGWGEGESQDKAQHLERGLDRIAQLNLERVGDPLRAQCVPVPCPTPPDANCRETQRR
jgi:hypothetical protein